MPLTIPEKVRPDTSLKAGSGSLNSLASCKTFTIPAILQFVAKVASLETHCDQSQLHLVECLLRSVKGIIQCDVVRRQLAALFLLVGILLICCGRGELVRLGNFSSQLHSFFERERERLCFFFTIL